MIAGEFSPAPLLFPQNLKENSRAVKLLKNTKINIEIGK
jgi:hypothetical protein